MENTTNINDLPVEPDYGERLEMTREMPPPMPQPMPREMTEDTRKKVRFNVPEKTMLEKHYTLILASILFLFFSDTKVKIYFMNILVVIFGDSLRTTGGSSTKVGQLFYMSLFGVTLWLSTILVGWRL